MRRCLLLLGALLCAVSLCACNLSVLSGAPTHTPPRALTLPAQPDDIDMALFSPLFVRDFTVVQRSDQQADILLFIFNASDKTIVSIEGAVFFYDEKGKALKLGGDWPYVTTFDTSLAPKLRGAQLYWTVSASYTQQLSLCYCLLLIRTIRFDDGSTFENPRFVNTANGYFDARKIELTSPLLLWRIPTP